MSKTSVKATIFRNIRFARKLTATFSLQQSGNVTQIIVVIQKHYKGTSQGISTVYEYDIC